MDHSFVICAYKESRYLEDCILSLKNQTRQTKIVMATSTPNEFIKNLAEKYDIPLFINKGESGIGGDWNFALSCCETPLITIAHQDDVYEPEYTEKIVAAAEKAKNPIIVFSGYGELREGKKVCSNRNLNIKKILLLPIRMFKSSIFARRAALSLGNCICCPAVTYSRNIIMENPFKIGFKSNLDWQQWENLSKKKGSFVYVNEPLMCHRIHSESTTSEIIENNARAAEDEAIFRLFWPEKTAHFIAKLYSNSEKSNKKA